MKMNKVKNYAVTYENVIDNEYSSETVTVGNVMFVQTEELAKSWVKYLTEQREAALSFLSKDAVDWRAEYWITHMVPNYPNYPRKPEVWWDFFDKAEKEYQVLMAKFNEEVKQYTVDRNAFYAGLYSGEKEFIAKNNPWQKIPEMFHTIISMDGTLTFKYEEVSIVTSDPFESENK